MAPRLRVEADLTFSLTGAPGARPDGTAVRGTVTADGTHLTLRTDDLLALSTAGDERAVADLASVLAANGFTLTVCGPRGAVATLGAVRSRLLHRLLTRSRHVRVDSWGEAWRVRRAQRGTTGPQVDAPIFAPPSTPFPLAPTFRRSLRAVTTTHDPLGGGRPQLVLAAGPAPRQDLRRRAFRLAPGVTTIGSGAGVDLRLPDLAPLHAEIRRDDRDEYVLVALDPDAEVLVNGARIERQVLRTGTRIQLGPWRMSYWRAEFADHGRPYGGREGGELSHQRDQPSPSYRPPPPPARS